MHFWHFCVILLIVLIFSYILLLLAYSSPRSLTLIYSLWLGLVIFMHAVIMWEEASNPTFSLTTGSPDDNSVYDLFDLARVSKRQNGVTLVKGPDLYSPAYKVLNADLIPSVPNSSFRDILDSILAERGFLLIINLKQIKRSRGSILTIEKNDGSGSIFEIVSDGKTNTLEVVYFIANQRHVMPIVDADLATGHWKNITLFVQDDRVKLYVDCEEVNEVEMYLPIQKLLSQELADIATLRIAKGTTKDKFTVRSTNLFSVWRRNISLTCVIRFSGSASECALCFWDLTWCHSEKQRMPEWRWDKLRSFYPP